MFTLITGNPGAGKTLYAVWELLRPVPGTFVEDSNGRPVPRRLLANITDLTLDHELLDAELLANWHTWGKPGDVICGDEIQHVFRPRTLGSKVPEAIQAVETHRHMGVDLIFITQHPNLMDVNLRRLVNRHFHVRRITPGVSMVYEWDHCGTPGDYKGCLSSRLWRHKKAGYALYKSAQVHTKPTVRLPPVAAIGGVALLALAGIGPYAYSRVNASLGGGDQVKAKPVVTVTEAPAALPVVPASAPVLPELPQAPVGPPTPLPAAPSAPAIAGCGQVRDVCRCFTATGEPVEVEATVCQAKLPRALPAGEVALRVLVPGPASPDVVPGDADLIGWAARRR